MCDHVRERIRFEKMSFKLKKKNTMEGGKPDGVRGNKLCRNTAPIAATNNGDFKHLDAV